MKKIFVFAAALFYGFLCSAQNWKSDVDTECAPVLFEFKYKEGDSFRILSTVNEDVFVNRFFDHHGVIVNRVSSEVVKINEDGSAVHEVNFMTSEESSSRSGKSFLWGEEYKSVFTRDKRGIYTIGNEYFMPTVRDVPVFPEEAVKPGDKWTFEGHEAHDLRNGFNLNEPFIVPFEAKYEFAGRDKNTGFYVIKCDYQMNMKSPVEAQGMSDWPVSINGFSSELIYWDEEKGAIDHYVESFRIVLQTYLGYSYEFRGDAHAEVTEFRQFNTKENLENVQNKVNELGIENVTVKNDENGLTISLENIQFKADSAELLESEKRKLEQIAVILEQFPSNDILVSGHTAHAGTAKIRQILSEERASSVADYLILLGVRDKYHIFTRGWGSTRPVAPNSSEEGKARNRRVEITILEK